MNACEQKFPIIQYCSLLPPSIYCHTLLQGTNSETKLEFDYKQTHNFASCFYMGVKQSLTFREEHRFLVFDSRVLRKILELMREEVTTKLEKTL
jgi:hypothetical protein